MAPADLSTQSNAKPSFPCCQMFSGLSSHIFSCQFPFIFTWTVRTLMGSAFALSPQKWILGKQFGIFTKANNSAVVIPLFLIKKAQTTPINLLLIYTIKQEVNYCSSTEHTKGVFLPNGEFCRGGQGRRLPPLQLLPLCSPPGCRYLAAPLSAAECCHHSQVISGDLL